MIKLTLFNLFTIELLNTKYLMRLIFDTSRCPFSFDIKVGLLYSVLPWFNKQTNEEYYGRSHTIIDILCPVLFDLRLYIEQ